MTRLFSRNVLILLVVFFSCAACARAGTTGDASSEAPEEVDDVAEVEGGVECTNDSHCDDLIACTIDHCTDGVCEPATGNCVSVDKPNGTLCDDADPCTEGDACTNGVCGGTAKDCSALDGPCTDGVCEAQNKQGQMFGRDRFKEIIRKNSNLEAEAIRKAVFEAVAAFREEAPQEDDITLLLMKFLS